jgi:hypothetical protein
MVLPVFFLGYQFPCASQLDRLLRIGHDRQQPKENDGDDML